MSESRSGVRLLLPPRKQKTGVSKEKQVIEAGAQSRLHKSGYRQLHSVSCEFHEGVLTLRGAYRPFT